MKAGELKIQLVGYAIDEEGTIDEIAKSPVIKAIIGDSVNGILREGDENPSMIELLKAKLDKLLEEGIGGGGGSGGTSIQRVSTYSDLPTVAKEGDIAIVSNEEYLETKSEEVFVPINLDTLPSYKITMKKDVSKLSLANLGLEGSEDDVMAQAMLLDLNYGIMIMHVGKNIVPLLTGDESATNDLFACMLQIPDASESDPMYINLSGAPIMFMLSSFLGLELEEEQWRTLLGDHFDDTMADNPSYGWVKIIPSSEPINDNSLDLGGQYITVDFDYEVDISYTSTLISGEIYIVDSEENSLFEGYLELESDLEYVAAPDEFSMKLALSTVLNSIGCSNIYTEEFDVYRPKGLYRYDTEWRHIESDSNLPIAVNTYADLPESSIPNGVAFVLESSYNLEYSTETSSIISPGSFYIDSFVEDLSTFESAREVIHEYVDAWNNCASEFGLVLKFPTRTPTYEDQSCFRYYYTTDGSKNIDLALIQFRYYSHVYTYDGHKETKKYDVYTEHLCILKVPDGYNWKESPFAGAPYDYYYSENVFPEIPGLNKWYSWEVFYDKEGNRCSEAYPEFRESVIPKNLPVDILAMMYSVDYVGGSKDENEDGYYLNPLDLGLLNLINKEDCKEESHSEGLYVYDGEKWNHKQIGNKLTDAMISNIAKSASQRHTHNNLSTLDGFSEESGMISYKESPLQPILRIEDINIDELESIEDGKALILKLKPFTIYRFRLQDSYADLSHVKRLIISVENVRKINGAISGFSLVDMPYVFIPTTDMLDIYSSSISMNIRKEEMFKQLNLLPVDNYHQYQYALPYMIIETVTFQHSDAVYKARIVDGIEGGILI
jgi:hypothetical protein